MYVVRRHPDYGYLSDNFWVPKKYINIEATKSALTFTQNTRDGEGKTLALWQETDHHIVVPREFWHPEDFPFETLDIRPLEFTKVDIRSKIVLDQKSAKGVTVQKDTFDIMLASRGGVIQLACGIGKTVIALHLIAARSVPALVIVDNTQLLAQWVREIGKHLVVPGGVGLIQAGSFDWKRPLVLGTYHTVAARAAMMSEEVRRWFGTIVWDEAHHVGAMTFSRSADLFYGARYGLTATPEREDGFHVVHGFHIGPVLYKNLTQELRPRIYFYWTGLELDLTNPEIADQVLDINKDLHTGMVAGYFGRWRGRLDLILGEVGKAVDEGRRVLVLSHSIAELVNLFALWAGETELYTDIQMPTKDELAEGVDPVEIPEKVYKRLIINLKELRAELADPNTDATRRQHINFKIQESDVRLKQHDAWKKATSILERRRREYIQRVLRTNKSNAGLMIGSIKPMERHRMLAEKQVTFAIMKYGREGLDEPSLDTAFVCEPISQKGGLQQLLGRVLRKRYGKKAPVVVFFEDNIGPMMGMCQKLRKHLKFWPVEDGGPFDYELIGHPIRRSTKWSTPKTSWI